MEGNTKPQKPKKGSKARAYRLIQEIAVARDKVCQHPECMKRVDCGHHTWPRAWMGTAFEPDSIVGYCAEHHQWAHSHRTEHLRILGRKIGEGRIVELNKRAHSVVRNLDMDAVCEFLEKVLRAYRRAG